MVRVNDKQYWLYAAVDPAIPNSTTSSCFATYTIPITEEFLPELTEKHDVTDAVFLIDDAIPIRMWTSPGMTPVDGRVSSSKPVA